MPPPPPQPIRRHELRLHRGGDLTAAIGSSREKAQKAQKAQKSVTIKGFCVVGRDAPLILVAALKALPQWPNLLGIGEDFLRLTIARFGCDFALLREAVNERLRALAASRLNLALGLTLPYISRDG